MGGSILYVTLTARQRGSKNLFLGCPSILHFELFSYFLTFGKSIVPNRTFGTNIVPNRTFGTNFVPHCTLGINLV